MESSFREGEEIPGLNCVARFLDLGKDDIVWVIGAEGIGSRGRRQQGRPSYSWI